MLTIAFKVTAMKTVIPFVFEDSFDYGQIGIVSPRVRRIVARNPSRFTLHGTGTYIVGHGEVAVIDPGPLQTEHIEAIAASLAGETITHILVTHTHSDHSPAAGALQKICQAPVYGALSNHRMFRAAPAAETHVHEEVDHLFQPDITLADGQVLKGADWTLEAMHTPGHMPNHFCFRLPEENAVFTGDHVMGWSTTVIIPPYGSMSAYVNSLQRLQGCGYQTFYPAHGPPVTEPERYLNALIAHRRDREDEVIASLRQGLKTVPEMVAVHYADVGTALHAAAACSLLATLIKLVEEGRIVCTGNPAAASEFSLAA